MARHVCQVKLVIAKIFSCLQPMGTNGNGSFQMALVCLRLAMRSGPLQAANMCMSLLGFGPLVAAGSPNKSAILLANQTFCAGSGLM